MLEFRQLFDDFYPAIYRFFSKRGFDREECRDLAQETFLLAYRGRESFRGDAGPSTWLFAIAANVFRKEIRRRTSHKRRGVEVSYEPFLAAELDDSVRREPGPLERVIDGERSASLKAAIADLPAQMRRCVRLRVEQDLSYREIATLLGVSLDTVKAHLFQARKRLRRQLHGDAPPGDVKGVETR